MDISVVICTYNRPLSLTRAIASCLNQTILPLEIIIVDDGNLSDEYISCHKNRIEAKGVKFLYVKKCEVERGLTKSRNVGWKVARGKIIQFIDDDAELRESAIQIVEQVFSADRDGRIVAIDFPIDEQARRKRGRRIIELLYEIGGFWRVGKRFWRHRNVPFEVKSITDIKAERFLQGGSLAIRKQSLEEIGGFDELLGISSIGEDKDISIRLDKIGVLCRITSMSVIHYSEPAGRIDGFSLGCEIGFNYLYISSKMGELGVGEWLLLTYNLGILILIEIIFACVGNRKYHYSQVAGIIVGIIRFIRKILCRNL